MTKAKKFGAFAGVFTPSILTILGVIMYMRLGWVVGQAGLINAVIIIILAHVISLSTGLSVSSIATDKKIKAGGIYYILSRSLGLPMGGSIGITLFIGTALSISLYLVGFAENFLSIEPIRLFLGLEENKFGYQVVGTGAIILLVLIAFISTSLAIKTQFYILGAIALSIVSIGIGFFIHTDIHPETVILHPTTEAIPMELIFAVFFPAVTGFTAGIAMSGDLKDPKKSIPFGTMAATITGFIIYIMLAVGIAFFANRDLLLNDYNFLMKVAWFSPLVIAGIWGATLSSALGGILGGPRILQAMSSDKIGPGIFAKGHGVNNEPRNALLLIFIIAEAGILIGELNVIAGIVSMFYLASYGFINIAYYLESWASADFRPTFKINRYIGLIGFIAAFGVMFKLDMISMFAALIIMMGIYFFLKRKQLKLDYGDVWQSVWSSFMRTALQKMDNSDEVERNWQPNIILFSGGTKKRPHLLSLGECLVGRHGVLSNFDLIENKNAKVLFPKKNQSMPGELSARGVFTRRQTVKDIYDGIDMISRTYGFSGLEPNTVMLGWARQTRKPEKFVNLLKTLYDLDLNVLMLGYDKEVGYGKKQTIDIWFKDKSNHGNFALTLSKLLLLSDDWHHARVRVLVVNFNNDKSDTIYRKMEGILDHMRVDADIKIINNQIERKPFYQIVETESVLTDLVFLEIPKIEHDQEVNFVEETASLLDKIGTVMLIEASSSFKKLKIGIEEQETETDITLLKKTIKNIKLPPIAVPTKQELELEITELSDTIQGLSNEYFSKTYLPLLVYRSEKIKMIQQAIDKSFEVLQSKANKMSPRERVQLISQLITGLLVRMGKIIDEQLKKIPAEAQENLEKGTELFLNNLHASIKKIPSHVLIKYTGDDLSSNPNETLGVRSYKNRNLLFKKKMLKRGGIPYKLKMQKLSLTDLPLKNLEAVQNIFTAFGQYNIAFIFEFQKLLYSISDSLSYIENHASDEDITNKALDGKQSVEIHLQRLNQTNEEIKNDLLQSLLSSGIETVNTISEKIQQVPANKFIESIPKKKIKETTRLIQSLPGKWASNHKNLLRYIHIESQLLVVEYRLGKITREAMNEIHRQIDEQVLEKINQVVLSFDNKKPNSKGNSNQTPLILSLSINQLQLSFNKIIDKAFRNIKSTLRQIPESVEIFTEETINEITNSQFNQPETTKIQVFRLVDYFVQNEVIAPLVNSTNKLVKDIHSSLTKIEDASRLISLSQQSGVERNFDDDYDSVGDMKTFLSDQKAHIDHNVTEIQSGFNLFQKNILANLNKSGSELHLFRLSKFAENNTVFSRKEARKKVRFIRTGLDKTKAFIQKQRANLWYSRSEARLFAKKITDGGNTGPTVIDQVLNMKDSVTIKPGNLEKLPFYYQQLFLSKYNFQSEFWYGRNQELSEAKKAMKRFRKGNKGTLIITGDRRSGKSFFANHITSSLKDEEKVYTISPSGVGSTSLADLKSAMEETLESKGSLDKMLEGLPENTILIFDDLELWWEKSTQGNAMLETLFHMIRNHCHKIFFILVINRSSFNIMNQVQPFEDFALQTIKLQAFSSKELQEIILFRHRTSGFNLQIDSILPTGLTQAKQARLFNQVFKFSGGNVGAALLGWIAHIKDFKNDTIYVISPTTPDEEVLDNLTGEMKVYLMQFVLHKRLNIEKLERIMLHDSDKIKYVLQYMKRAGLIQEQAENVYEIDIYMQSHIAKYLFNSYDKFEQ